MGDAMEQPIFAGIPVPVQELSKPVIGQGGYTGFNPRTEILRRGWQHSPTSKALSSAILIEHDFGIRVRDGATLYMDIYRPALTNEAVPAVICWGPFGKKFNGITSLKLMTPWNLGIPEGRLSGLEKFEAPDPADWCARGYAIVNIDSRGSGDSEGVCAIMGTQEAEDGYDVIEAIAKLPWCSGNIGMAGNSHLAIIQWFIAALRPPSLKAIAPWEGCGDLFREQFVRGGIYGGDLFDNLIAKYLIQGRHGMESFRKQFDRYPLANAWWNDKRPDMTKITIPTYITGTWTNTMHGMGAIRGWREVATDKKWLRWHPYQEWYDLWGSQESLDELFLFFDRYLKNTANDWEATPRVRMAVLRHGQKAPIKNQIEDDFPLPRTDYRTMYLDSHTGKLQPQLPTETGQSSYDSVDGSSVIFTHTFATTTSLVGIPKAVLYMSAPEHDDMDVYICLKKLAADGTEMLNLNIPWDGHNVPVKSIAEIPAKDRTEVILYVGPIGMLRASHRKIDSARSMHENWPFHPHDEEHKIPPGTVVRLEIGIWAMGTEYEEGESIQVHVGGRYPGIANFGTNEHNLNRGRNVVYTGGEYASYVVLPFV